RWSPTMSPPEARVIDLLGRFGPHSYGQLATICGMGLGPFRRVRNRLQERGYVTPLVVYAKEPPTFVAPAYLHLESSLRELPPEHVRRLANRLRNRQGTLLKRIPILAITPLGAVAAAGAVADLSKPFQASHWLAVASLVSVHMLAADRQQGASGPPFDQS